MIDLKRDVPVGCKQTDEDQLTFEMLEKAENQDNFQELLLASPKTYPDLATKYEETKCVAAASSKARVCGFTGLSLIPKCDVDIWEVLTPNPFGVFFVSGRAQSG